MASSSDDENPDERESELESDEAPERSRKARKPSKILDPCNGITQKQADQATLEGLCLFGVNPGKVVLHGVYVRKYRNLYLCCHGII